MRTEPLAAGRQICRYDPSQFEDWFADLQEKAGHRVDPMAAGYLWERGYSIMDAIIKIVSK